MEEAVIQLTQFIILFIVTIVFSLVALNRKSIVSNGLASLLWVVLAISSFIVGSSVIGVTLSWVTGLVGFIFAGTFISALITAWLDAKHARFEF